MRVCVCAHACVCACVCACACTRVYARVCACVCAYVCMCAHVCVCMCVHVCTRARVRVCARTCACVHACACSRARVCARVCVCVYTFFSITVYCTILNIVLSAVQYSLIAFPFYIQNLVPAKPNLHSILLQECSPVLPETPALVGSSCFGETSPCPPSGASLILSNVCIPVSGVPSGQKVSLRKN